MDPPGDGHQPRGTTGRQRSVLLAITARFRDRQRSESHGRRHTLRQDRWTPGGQPCGMTHRYPPFTSVRYELTVAGRAGWGARPIEVERGGA